MKNKTKKNRRQSVKFASLKKEYNSRIRQEYLDQDYLDVLDDTVKNVKLPDGTMVTQLEYIAIFMKEYNNAGVGKQSDAKDNKFHRTAKEVKDCTDRNNRRNRDQYGRAKIYNLMNNADYNDLVHLIDKESVINPNSTEDAMIELLDKSKKLNKATDNSDK